MNKLLIRDRKNGITLTSKDLEPARKPVEKPALHTSRDGDAETMTLASQAMIGALVMLAGFGVWFAISNGMLGVLSSKTITIGLMWLACAVFCGSFAASAGLPRSRGWVIGGLLGIIGVIVMVVVWAVRAPGRRE